MKQIVLKADCNLSFDVEVETPMVFMLRPCSSERQWVAEEQYQLSPAVPVEEFTDGFGNLCQRLVAPTGEFYVHTSVTARISVDAPAPSNGGFVDVSCLPHDSLCYLLPSRYCETDRFGDMATGIVADEQPGYRQVLAIVDWVRGAIRNEPLSSTYPVSAVEVNERRYGVCRDLAHICIAMCRAICIPARLVVGYLHELDPMDAHAWFEAYVGDQWVTFDPTLSGRRGIRLVLARGRDAADVALYNQYGPLLLPTDMSVSVTKLHDSTLG